MSSQNNNRQEEQHEYREVFLTPKQHHQYATSNNAGGDHQGNNDGIPIINFTGASRETEYTGTNNNSVISFSWEVEDVRKSLRDAVTELSNHSLKLSSKWAAEQLMGLPPPSLNKNKKSVLSTEDNNDHRSNNSIIDSIQKDVSYEEDHDFVLYARSLISMGEYERAAYALSSRDQNSNTGDGNDGAATASSTFCKFSRDSLIFELPPPLPELSATGIFLRAYAFYLSGEQRKEEKIIELRGQQQHHQSQQTASSNNNANMDAAGVSSQRYNSITNENLPQLEAELKHFYFEDRAKTQNNDDNNKNNDNRKLNAFGLYIYGIVVRELQKQQNQSSSPSLMSQQKIKETSSTSFAEKSPFCHFLFTESILKYPLNWSAWLDLAKMCIENPMITESVELALAPLSEHWMYHFFLIYVFIEQQQHDHALLLIEKLVVGQSSSSGMGNEDQEEGSHNFENNGYGDGDGLFTQCRFLESMTAVAHYNMRDYDTAKAHFEQLSQQDPHRLEKMDIYSNILYVKEQKAELSHLAHSAMRIDKYRPETCCIIGNYYSLKGQHEKAIIYFQRALRLDRSCLSAWTLMGHEFIEMKNTAAAIESYRRAVDINPRDHRAWYGLGQTYEILNMPLYALHYHRKATTLRPYDARMWCAMGGCYQALDRVTDAMRSYERAVSNQDREGVATKKLASLYRDEGEDEKAANCYMMYLRLKIQQQESSPRPDDSLTVGGGISGQKISDDFIVNLVHVDVAEAEALLYLAYYYRDNNKFETSVKCCTRLLEYPGPEKEEAKALLREIKSRVESNRQKKKKTTTKNGDQQARTNHASSGEESDHDHDDSSWKGGRRRDRDESKSPFQFSP